MAREEARRVKAALDREEKKKEAYVAEMKEQGFNLGSVGGSLTQEEEEMLGRVEGGGQLLMAEKGGHAVSAGGPFPHFLPPSHPY